MSKAAFIVLFVLAVVAADVTVVACSVLALGDRAEFVSVPFGFILGWYLIRLYRWAATRLVVTK